MAIKEVPGYGQITSSNAYEIYLKYMRGEKFDGEDLNAAQAKYCKSLLSDEQLDEIEYDSNVRENQATNDGKSQIEGADMLSDGEDADGNKIKSKSEQQADSVAPSVVTSATGAAAGAVGVAGSIGATAAATSAASTEAAAETAKINGFCAVIGGAIAVAFGAVSVAMAAIFDSNYQQRTELEKASEQNNATMDANADALAESMDAMNEDMASYEADCAAYTDSVNEDTASAASLQSQIQDAEAAGDTEGAKKLKEELKAISESDHSDELEGLQGTRDQLEEYSYANMEATGVKEGAQTVSDFLKEGKGLGAAAIVCGALDLANAVMCVLSAAIAVIPKIFTPIPIDAPMAAAGGILLLAAGALFGASGGMYMDKGKNELKCGESGDGMQDHVNELNDMIGQQEGYIELTAGEYDAQDEASQESQDQASEAADKVTSNRKPGQPKEGDNDSGGSVGSGSSGDFHGTSGSGSFGGSHGSSGSSSSSGGFGSLTFS